MIRKVSWNSRKPFGAALAFDLAGACFLQCHEWLPSLLDSETAEAPPPGYARLSTAQMLGASRVAFTRIVETLKACVGNLMVPCCLMRPSNRSCWIPRCPLICCRLLLTELRLLLVLTPAVSRESSIKLVVGLRAVARRVRGPWAPKSSLASLGRPPEVRGSDGLSIWPKAV